MALVPWKMSEKQAFRRFHAGGSQSRLLANGYLRPLLGVSILGQSREDEAGAAWEGRDTVTGVGDTKPAVSASRPQLNEGSHSELEMLRSRRWAFLVPFMLAFGVEPDDEPFLGIAFRVVDLPPDPRLSSHRTAVSLLGAAAVVAFCASAFARLPRLTWEPGLRSWQDRLETQWVKHYLVGVARARNPRDVQTKGPPFFTSSRQQISALPGWFLLDAVAAIPWTWIGDSSVAQARKEGEMVTVEPVTRGLKVVRLIRLARLLRLAKLRQITEAAETYLEGNYAAELFMGFGKVLLLLSAVAHWGACFWHAVGSQQGGWVAELEEDWQGHSRVTPCAKYTWSLYFTLTTLTTVGYGDITPVTTEECRWVLLLLLTSAVIFSGLLGMLSDLVASVNKEHRIVAAKKRQLARYMSWRAVPKTLLCKVRRYFLFKWGTQKDYDLYEEELKKALTPTLRSELCYHIYKDASQVAETARQEVLNAAPFLAWRRAQSTDLDERPHGLREEPGHQQLGVRSGFHDCGDFLFRAGEEVKDIFILLAGTTILYRTGASELVNPSAPTCASEAGGRERSDGGNDRDADAQEDEQDAFLPAWAELEGPGLASQRRALLRHMISSLVKRMKARSRRFSGGRGRKDGGAAFKKEGKQRSTSLGRSRSNDLESQFVERWHDENLLRGLSELRKQDAVQKHAAMLIQLVWRERMRKKLDEIHKKHRPSSCYTIEAPAYFAESLHQYTVRVKSQVETVSIPRLAILLVIEKFSPWLRHRFEVFQAAVLEEKESIGETVSPKFSGKQSSSGENGERSRGSGGSGEDSWWW
ncbi:Potassium voltage-gated channel subfamily H member 2 (Ether-a-go-go-related gene potassium channel 1) (DERG) (ERG-1) (Eag-related protein 1) (Ether-a-go-go-related protein 1) (c-ERG) (Voltage-gated potassium channel subunit Kv11.1) [Durusdinium trenchii]|uniref:Ion transport domain-containing protein n=1 Tax=Durusdinium trenchii TaxID=1381693 RepID=A0ABP0M7E4_9DINO